MFSCEYCEICKNTFFIENLRTTASELLRTPIFTEHFRWLLLVFWEICKFLEERLFWVATFEVARNISAHQLLSQSTLLLGFYQKKINKNEMVKQIALSTNGIRQ